MRCNLLGIGGLNVTMASRQARDRIGVKNRGFITIRNVDRDTVIVRQVRRLPAALLPESDDKTVFVSEFDLKLLNVNAGDELDVTTSHEELECP